MFGFPSRPKNQTQSKSNLKDFDYLLQDAYYFDSACQTLRPQVVIEAMESYFQKYNSCGHRVHYPWGVRTDTIVTACRQNLLQLVGKSSKDYTVAFTLNTTFGINTVLQQIDPQKMGITQIVTSSIEHNSVFVSSMTAAKRFGLSRIVLERNENPLDPEFGNLNYTPVDLEQSLVILNSMSNIDGRVLHNAPQIAKDVHAGGGLLLIDACQTFGHEPGFLKSVEFDACFGSGHKMYGPSVGFIIIKKDLLKSLDCFWIGGSTVQDVGLDHYQLIDNDQEIYARIEPGLQNFSGIIGLNAALDWKSDWKSSQKIDSDNHILPLDARGLSAVEYEQFLATYLWERLQEVSDIYPTNPSASSTVSLYSPKIDGHQLGLYLAEVGIMCRTGYHCCHYYLKEKSKLPPLFRISLGLHNTPQQIDYLIQKLQVVLR